ncbi:MAG TPA: hypothetical protein VHH72_08155 [Solirubrobacterales bacterium]|jgi:hypothetical protein|nr:hypothetical protein [Solirubrobacterales bacterium]
MRKHRRSPLGVFLTVALVAAFAAVPAAYGQGDPLGAQYPTDGQGTSGVAASGGSNDPPAPPAPAVAEETGLNNNVGSLPFTGIDLLIVVGVALVLTGTGFGLRRLSSPRGPAV